MFKTGRREKDAKIHLSNWYWGTTFWESGGKICSRLKKEASNEEFQPSNFGKVFSSLRFAPVGAKHVAENLKHHMKFSKEFSVYEHGRTFYLIKSAALFQLQWNFRIFPNNSLIQFSAAESFHCFQFLFMRSSGSCESLKII